MQRLPVLQPSTRFHDLLGGGDDEEMVQRDKRNIGHGDPVWSNTIERNSMHNFITEKKEEVNPQEAGGWSLFPDRDKNRPSNNKKEGHIVEITRELMQAGHVIRPRRHTHIRKYTLHTATLNRRCVWRWERGTPPEECCLLNCTHTSQPLGNASRGLLMHIDCTQRADNRTARRLELMFTKGGALHHTLCGKGPS